MRRILFAVTLFCSLSSMATQAPSDTENAIFGIGYGEVSSEAERDALAQIAMRLSARISVEEKTLLSSQNGVSGSQFLSASTVHTDELLIPSYTIVERNEFAGQQQVVISVERAHIESLYQLEAENALNQVEGHITNTPATSAYRQLIQAISNDVLLSQSQRYIRVLIGLDIDSKETEHLVARYQHLNAVHSQNIQPLSLNVTGDARSQVAIEALHDNALALGIAIHPSAPLQLVVRSKEKQASSSGKIVAARRLVIDVREQGQIDNVLQRELDFMSEPLHSKSAATAYLDKKVRESFLVNGLVRIVGINTNEN
ncbi:hypothetical protein [Thaumasiovibrio sp. DFM-14]|uniref:hypothetical protein n=1 Tax=Thaumasiovibrio sp. DFM-14 TaxID=3384792 RepID=UPI0039A13F95